MTNTDYNNATAAFNASAKCAAIETKAAAAGAKASVALLDADGNTVSSQADIIAAIGQTAYDTLVSSVLVDLDAAVTTAKSAADTALTAL